MAVLSFLMGEFGWGSCVQELFWVICALLWYSDLSCTGIMEWISGRIWGISSCTWQYFLHHDTFRVLFLLLDTQSMEMVGHISQALAKLHYHDGILGPNPHRGLRCKIFSA